MIVFMQGKGPSTTGLNTVPANVRRQFHEYARGIEIRFEDLLIDCELRPGFWHDEAEIADLRLCSWRARSKAQRESLPATSRMVMFPSGKRRSRLQIVSERDHDPAPPEPAA